MGLSRRFRTRVDVLVIAAVVVVAIVSADSVGEETADERSLCDGGGGHRSGDRLFLGHGDNGNL